MDFINHQKNFSGGYFYNLLIFILDLFLDFGLIKAMKVHPCVMQIVVLISAYNLYKPTAAEIFNMTDKQRTDLLTIPPGAVIYDRLVYEKECKAYTGLCRMTRLRMEKAGTFPVPRRLDDTKTAKNAWLLSELVAWARSWAQVNHGPDTGDEDTSGYATLTSAEEMVRHMNEILANM
ncbi:hypothetical protein LDK78_07820 [Escherichia coli]|nr:hypothetical protein [Escherichia coli]